MLGFGQQRTIHVEVPAGLEHQRPPQVIVVLADELPLLENRPAFDGRKSLDDEPQRLTGSMRIDAANRGGAQGSGLKAQGRPG